MGSGGGSGIRTRDTVSRIHTFQACAFNHSATPPQHAPEGARNLFIEGARAKGALCAFNHSATPPQSTPLDVGEIVPSKGHAVESALIAHRPGGAIFFAIKV